MQEESEWFERALRSKRASHPGLVADLGEGQEMEVAHLVTDPLETLLFCRVHGTALNGPHFQPQIRPIYPPELAYGGAGGPVWGDYRVFTMPPLLPHRREIVVGFVPGIPLGPSGRPTPEMDELMSRWHASPPALLAIPVPPWAKSDSPRQLSRPIHTFPDGLSVRVLGAETSDAATAISLLPGQPGMDLHGSHLGPAWVPPPPGGPADLWREMPVAGRPGGFRLGSDRRKPLRREEWEARSLETGGPGEAPAAGPGAPLALRSFGGAQGHVHPFGLRFGPLPDSAGGLRLRKAVLYQGSPAEARTVVPGPGAQGIHAAGPTIDLTGHTLAGPDFRLDLLAWEESDQGFLLIGRPDAPPAAPGWPGWLPDIRLVLEGGSTSLNAFPCEDGTICAYLPAHLAQDEIHLGIRAVGRRLPPLELDLWLEG